MRLIVSSTRARVSGATLGAPFRTRDAVVLETFAARARSRIVGSRCEFRVSGVWPTLGTFPKRMTSPPRQATDKRPKPTVESRLSHPGFDGDLTAGRCPGGRRCSGDGKNA